MQKAHDKFLELLKQEYPNLSIRLDWPGPEQDFVYPFLAIITVRNDLEKWTPEFLETETTDTAHVSYYVAGEWMSRFDLHYFSKDAEQKDLREFSQKLIKFFQKGFIREGRASATFDFQFGDKDFEWANLTLQSHSLKQGFNNFGNSSIQTGERRAIFEIVLDIPEIITNTEPILTDLQLDGELKEGLKINK